MRYMLLMVASPDADPAPARSAPASDEPCWLPWYREMTARGVLLIDGAQLQPTTTATTVAVCAGETLLLDGPFAETKEQIIGYNVIDVADLDEAVHVASRHPVTMRGGRVEIRPIIPAA